MVTLAELAKELGLSPHAARRRLEALRRLGNGHLSAGLARGPRGQVLIDDGVAQVLREAEEIARQEGLPYAQALAKVLNGGATLALRDERADEILAKAILWAGIAVGGGLFAGLALLALAVALRG